MWITHFSSAPIMIPGRPVFKFNRCEQCGSYFDTFCTGQKCLPHRLPQDSWLGAACVSWQSELLTPLTKWLNACNNACQWHGCVLVNLLMCWSLFPSSKQGQDVGQWHHASGVRPKRADQLRCLQHFPVLQQSLRPQVCLRYFLAPFKCVTACRCDLLTCQF